MRSPGSPRPLPLVSSSTACLLTRSAGFETSGVLVESLQSPSTAQAGSPPPTTLALFSTGFAAAAVGVTSIVKLAVLPGATCDRPEGTVQATTWPATLQPGAASMVTPAGSVSVTVASAVVAALPPLVTTSV